MFAGVDDPAIGDGNADFLIDEPGDLHVRDFDLAAFQTPWTSPFTTSEVFAPAPGSLLAGP